MSPCSRRFLLCDGPATMVRIGSTTILVPGDGRADGTLFLGSPAGQAAGTYTLTELRAPAGYTLASPRNYVIVSGQPTTLSVTNAAGSGS